MGKAAVVDREFVTNQQLNTIVPNLRVDADYLYYSLCTRREELKRLGSVGTRTPIVNKSVFSSLRIPLPTIEVQKRIAGILSAYDDLIETCERRIRVLEAMARALYREWFVNFRYPGHENVPLVESALGQIPKGWEAGSIASASDYLSRGLSPKYDNEGRSLVLNQKCIRDQRLNLGPARRQSKPVPEEKAVRAGDVLINSTGVGTLGRVAQVLADIPTCTADSHVSIVRPGKGVDSTYFGLALLALESTFERKGVGATGQTELSRAAIGETPLCLPPVKLQHQFSDIVQPIRACALSLQYRIENLRKTRDLLLPRLLSGQLSVEDLP